MNVEDLPVFPYHRDPVASGSLRESVDPCECCGEARGILYNGSAYCVEDVASLCPWCIADGSAASKYKAEFVDGFFCDSNYEMVDLTREAHEAVFCRTLGFSSFNPVGWWVHCGEPAEYVKRIEPYELVFECRRCKKRQVIEDLD